MNQQNPLRDLNLHHLLALDAVLERGSVTRAAERLGLSQSAVSHALSGLRDQLGDPLVVRGPDGMQPTPRGQALATPLRRALRDLAAALSEAPAFDPQTAHHTFRLATVDGFALLLLPPLLALLRAEAPGVDLDLRAPPAGGTGPALAMGDLDLAIGVGVPASRGLRTRLLHEESFACLVRAGHPAVGEALDLDTYCALPHALMSPMGSGPGVVDEALADLGRSRRVALRMRSFVAAPLVVASSDLVLTGPRAQLAQMSTLAPLRLLEPPLPLPGFQLRAYWNERVQADPAHRWLRGAVVRAVAEAHAASLGSDPATAPAAR